MAKEIERKYLVNDDSYKVMAVKAVAIKQSYLNRDPQCTVRIRIKGNQGFLTVKGITVGATRDEWEYPIPASDAEEMAERLTGGWGIDKTRYIVEYGGFIWEVDEFHGRHDGLVVAEVELPSEHTAVKLPPFVGQEVTGDSRYYNSTLAK
ncbi:MAG: CYTH domain-containing protein [Duncaniella sp.]|nr:CYTH domain-containing protein [Duncaniella sp.]